MLTPLSPPVFQSALAEAKKAHFAGEFARARRLYDDILRHNPGEPGPMILLAELDMRDAKLMTAKGRLEDVAARFPESVEVRAALANLLEELGDTAATTAFYREETMRRPDDRDNWVKLAAALQTAGKLDEATAMFRLVIERWPRSVAGYYGLAAIDAALLSAGDIETLRAIADDERVGLDERVHAFFSLGNVREKQGAFDEAFAAFERGNRLRRENAALGQEIPAWMQMLPAGPSVFSSVEQAEQMHADFVRETMHTFSPAYFAKFGGRGHPSNAPIFIVGMPRSGSTLLEQILSSHPDVQGLGETMALSRTFREALAEMQRDPARANPATFYRRVGENYLAALKELGWDGRRRVIDKMLGNYVHLGIVQLALPNATIIHSLRDPVDTCLSNFRQLFGRRNEASYDLGAIGRQYVRYREVMAHWDRTLPGRVVTVEHERLIADSEAGIRHLVAACGLAWDEQCLRFTENERTVRTASVAQVRRPISAAAVQRWRKYEAHLQPLFAALGAYAPAR